MLKIPFKTLKRIVLSIILLFSYNMITNKFNLTIPINLYTIIITSIFSTSGFIGIILFYIVNFR